MKVEEIDKKELIKLCSSLISISDPVLFTSEFPTLAKWTDENVKPEDIEEAIEWAKNKIKNDSNVAAPKEDLQHLYAYTMAVIGFKEAAHRYPKIRALLLNLLTQEEFNTLLIKVTDIENSLKEKYSS